MFVHRNKKVKGWGLQGCGYACHFFNLGAPLCFVVGGGLALCFEQVAEFCVGVGIGWIYHECHVVNALHRAHGVGDDGATVGCVANFARDVVFIEIRHGEGKRATRNVATAHEFERGVTIGCVWGFKLKRDALRIDIIAQRAAAVGGTCEDVRVVVIKIEFNVAMVEEFARDGFGGNHFVGCFIAIIPKRGRAFAEQDGAPFDGAAFGFAFCGLADVDTSGLEDRALSGEVFRHSKKGFEQGWVLWGVSFCGRGCA
nr:MAG TPA: hypothetical protein [Caudoviricetes sp.]